ncbi:hypothetical protein L21SP5_03790 [Salinivirga cyanobacteriivorans]|uniref:Uncharacterized protein n=1 Tax=Salinivirga cyanobacteriivorans TaxID=1307839 RepID=A0A0S2I4S9_9BACT|nr:hypothetical protein L21SP5_03599 [Salinivirga cyanobacteriivorans]ALO17208.1 hypothetical protein L21SP5_03603 [Salinivirga cyanobacteriivorans]ALO17215.1 hypothetical protein L21SP5_03611 [Salinivirga cyanobacteriivorans]ALO17218.1 hypothetical protein L21SP5_03615 [Salinivirga cyanobacteriivorans]ALO17221.1 hypothetical protein L21SP5_03619 [Salinivirga cyanobacteriivorans]
MSRLVRRKVVQSDLSTEGSETAKTCTDAQEVHTEAGKGGLAITALQSLKSAFFSCRCNRNRSKDDVLTRGGLGLDSVFLYTKKSAEAVVTSGNEPNP